jgi:hypothetical protein
MVQEIVGHKDVPTPMNYIYLMTRPRTGARNSLNPDG